MRRTRDERLLAGESVAEESELTELLAAVRSFAAAPPPAPTAALQEVLAHGLESLPVRHARQVRRLGRAELRRSRLRRGALSLGLGAKLALGAAAAAAAMTGAATLEPVPEGIREPARAFVSRVVDWATPWSRGDRSPDEPGIQPDGQERDVSGRPEEQPRRRLGGTSDGTRETGGPTDQPRTRPEGPGQSSGPGAPADPGPTPGGDLGNERDGAGGSRSGTESRSGSADQNGAFREPYPYGDSKR